MNKCNFTISSSVGEVYFSSLAHIFKQIVHHFAFDSSSFRIICGFFKVPFQLRQGRFHFSDTFHMWNLSQFLTCSVFFSPVRFFMWITAYIIAFPCEFHCTSFKKKKKAIDAEISRIFQVHFNSVRTQPNNIHHPNYIICKSDFGLLVSLWLRHCCQLRTAFNRNFACFVHPVHSIPCIQSNVDKTKWRSKSATSNKVSWNQAKKKLVPNFVFRCGILLLVCVTVCMGTICPASEYIGRCAKVVHFNSYFLGTCKFTFMLFSFFDSFSAFLVESVNKKQRWSRDFYECFIWMIHAFSCFSVNAQIEDNGNCLACVFCYCLHSDHLVCRCDCLQATKKKPEESQPNHLISSIWNHNENSFSWRIRTTSW